MSNGWQPAQSYPDPAIITLDPRFDAIKPPMNAAVEQLYTGCRWSEGPVWFGEFRSLLWSDIPNNRILKWEEETAQVSIFRKPSNYANGNTRDRQGRLVTCEHGTRQVTRTEHDGSITVICNRYDGVDGKPLNSPNDIVVKSDGSIWFTDPAFGILAITRGLRPSPSFQPMSTGWTRTPAGRRSSLAISISQTGSASRLTKAECTSSNRARGRVRSASTTSSRTGQSSPIAASLAISARAPRTASAAMSTVICGAAGARVN
jgi:hypothetical protein